MNARLHVSSPFRLLVLACMAAAWAGEEPTIAASQIDRPRGGDIEIVVTDPQAKADTVVVFVRQSHHDGKLKAYRYDDGAPVTLKAEGAAGRYRGTFAVGEVVHQGTVVIEYAYNHLPASHNDHTRLVSCQVTMLFH